MKLKEFEARKLLEAVGIPLSFSVVISNIGEIVPFTGERLIKVQTIAGSRGKAGGIVKVGNKEEAGEVASKFLGKTFLEEEISEVLLDEKIDIVQELYLGILFDRSKRCPVLLFSECGGVNIEELHLEKLLRLEIDYVDGLQKEQVGAFLEKISLSEGVKNQLIDVIIKLYDCFVRFDCRMIEINPLVINSASRLIAVDAVAVLDDDARFRWEINFPERTDNRKATIREIAARQIDRDDHRGVAGKTFIDLDGDIAILTSGGGASMTLMDALISYGGKPANFTEYSGNPLREKVEKLTRIVLDREGLSGLLIAGVVANFTNIFETLQGVLDVLKEKRPDFPIVIRRAGPHDQEAKEAILKARDEFGLDIHYFDEQMPMTKAVEVMVNQSNRYKEKKGKENKGLEDSSGVSQWQS